MNEEVRGGKNPDYKVIQLENEPKKHQAHLAEA